MITAYEARTKCIKLKEDLKNNTKIDEEKDLEIIWTKINIAIDELDTSAVIYCNDIDVLKNESSSAKWDVLTSLILNNLRNKGFRAFLRRETQDWYFIISWEDLLYER